MSDKINDGGPAFPEQSIIAHGDMMKATTTPGMTLRDWFAGQALAGMDIAGCTDYPEIAAEAYIIADAMLEAREAE